MDTTSPPGPHEATGSALPFDNSRLGKLPTELLQSVVHHCPPCSLPSIACISPKLRALVERKLYRDVTLGWHIEEDDIPSQDLWPFYRTIQSRPDLSKKTESLNIKVIDRPISIETSASGVVPQGAMFPSIIHARWPEVFIACALLFWQMTELKHLSLSIAKYDDDDSGRPMLVPDCLSRLLLNFDSRIAHLQSFPGLQKLQSLKFQGTVFHWILAKFPYLEDIVLTRASQILADGASSEVNSAVKSLKVPVQSDVLSSACTYYDALSPFLAHFPCLETLRMPFNDADDGIAEHRKDFPLDTITLGSYNVLLRRLQPVEAVLIRLELDVSAHCGEVDTYFLDDVLPGDGFLKFKALKHLLVPYQCLFARADPEWSHILQPADEILPSTLETLKVHFPELTFLEWLTTLPCYRNKLPLLQRIGVACSSWVGAGYESLEFISYPHPALDILPSMGIEWSIDVPECCWDQAWDDYDLRTWDAVAWMDRTFGLSYRGTVFNRTPGDNSELYPPPVILEEEPRSADVVGVNPNAVVADDDAGDSPILPFTASELDLLLEATTAVLQAW